MQKLTEKDYQAIMEYTKTNPYVNLFIIGDLEKDGFNDEVQSFYGRYENGKLVNITLRYLDDSLHIYADELNAEDKEVLQELIDTYNPRDINFGEQTIPFVKDFIKENNFMIEECMLSVYTPNKVAENIPNKESNIKVDQATPEDAPALHSMCEIIFGQNSDRVDRIQTGLTDGTRIAYLVRENEKPVTMATAVALTNDAGMIISVGTLAEARNKGYAYACVETLCKRLYSDGRRGVLFYSDPIAGSIYHKIGFVDQEKYIMAQKK